MRALKNVTAKQCRAISRIAAITASEGDGGSHRRFDERGRSLALPAPAARRLGMRKSAFGDPHSQFVPSNVTTRREDWWHCGCAITTQTSSKNRSFGNVGEQVVVGFYAVHSEVISQLLLHCLIGSDRIHWRTSTLRMTRSTKSARALAPAERRAPCAAPGKGRAAW